ncbi:coiled-coil and C2 domain-containing protein 2A-like isoform X5 [Dreissena polymorpha]|uniref:coiled-coil and C2 domain-containing protein 2A-like isoform X5 n=1 Tax=Dreissena polymorpha TaxID=45954 RepID=UPI002264AA75|nr:coiled-coil and C2 domain-containing protein 2A-like isoform X5 [Dreissena polymorpha]
MTSNARRKRKDERLIQSEDEEEGISNPSMEGDLPEMTGTDSSPEMEAAEADALVKTLKTKRRRKKKELADEVISPKDDLARQLKEAKRKSRQKIEDAEREEMEESAPMSVVSDDGTLPMPEEEEREPAPEEAEGEEVRRLRKKKEETEETLIEGPPGEEEETPPPREEEEPPAKPPSPVPKEPSDEMPSKSLSIRDKMRMRMEKAKEEALSEVKEEEKESRKERRLQRDKKQTTRFDETKPYIIDENELDRITEEKRLQRLERRKKMPAKGREGFQMPTAEEAFDFFTREWKDEEKEEVEEGVEKAETEKAEKKEGEEAAEQEGAPKPDKPEDEQPLITQDDEMVSDLPTMMCAAYTPDINEQIKKEGEIYFVPSAAEIPATQKVGADFEVRRLEDEGFYVGKRPSAGSRNQNRMEHRLLKEIEKGRESSRAWFGEDGRLLALPDPLRSLPSRPPMPEEVEPVLKLDYKKAVIREFDNRYIDGTTEGIGHYQLDVDLNQVFFTHHHLYSKEHALAQKLTSLYEQYVIRERKNMTAYLGEKLKALKNSALHLQDHIAAHKVNFSIYSSEYNLTDRSNYDRRLQDYRAEIIQTRQQRDREEKTDRTLLRHILATWKAIKKERELQTFTNTPVKLQIRKEDGNKVEDERVWKQEVLAEIEELRDEHEREYKRNMLTYEEEMKRYQNQIQAKAEAQKRVDKRRKKIGSKQSIRSGAEDDEQHEKDLELLSEADLTLPDEPSHFDDATVRESVEKKARENRRRPGEPKLHLELSNTATITPTQNCNLDEQRRRADVSKCMIFVKILFNNKEVSRTNMKPLSQDFKVSYGQIYSMKIVQWPESIAFQVHESIGLGSTLVAELCAPIPDTSVTSVSVQLEDLEFSSDRKEKLNRAAVGSGMPFTYGSDNSQLEILMTTGILTYSVAWAVDEHGQALVPPALVNANTMFTHMKKMDPLAAIGAAGVMDLKKLADWFASSHLDPNDPSNADIVYLLRGKGGDTSHLTPAEYFRLEQLMVEFDFVTQQELEENKRFRLIQLRDEEVQEFKNYKMVPAHEREVPRDVFTEYERKKREEQRLKSEGDHDIETQRMAVKRYRQKIRDQVMRRFRRQAHMKNWEDMVKEDMVPNIALLGTSLMKVFARRTPLKPQRKKQKKVVAQSIKGDEVRIIVNISRAQNVPVRLSAAMQAGAESNESGNALWRSGAVTSRQDTRLLEQRFYDDYKHITMVRPFVEVMFQHHCIRTSVGDGSNPSFNEELEVPFRAPFDDYSPGNLQTVPDAVFLNIFDEVVVDIQEDDRERGRMVHQRIEKKWLGSLKIPFTTIYFNGKIDGTFRVNAPPVLLGYVYEGLSHGPDDIGINKDLKTLLGLFISIQPPLTQPEPVKERFSTNEDEATMVQADQWKEQISSRFTPKRELKTFVTDVNFKSVFITRYFRPINPPDEFTGKGPELVARYVSLIPFVPDAAIFPGLCDIWNTCDQFLAMLSGDEEEHAILLVNYFLHMGIKAWLICGNAIPEGPTAYVLTEEANVHYIWNPSSGERFRTNDATCPLRSIGCIVNNENIWANIQPYDKPDQMMYSLTETSCWEPLFNNSRRNPGLQSIQPERLYYLQTDKDFVTELQEKIQHVLKNKVMDWRSRYITRWNRHCSQIMRKTLPLLEESLGKSVDQDHIKELEASFSSYKVSGFPINMPFTEVDPIVETVYATGVHGHESNEIEFALAVYVHPYPNSVLSVWVYVASLMKNR